MYSVRGDLFFFPLAFYGVCCSLHMLTNFIPTSVPGNLPLSSFNQNQRPQKRRGRSSISAFYNDHGHEHNVRKNKIQCNLHHHSQDPPLCLDFDCRQLSTFARLDPIIRCCREYNVREADVAAEPRQQLRLKRYSTSRSGVYEPMPLAVVLW
jgi:hypothetical protein